MLNEDKAILETLSLLMPALKDFFIGDVVVCLSDNEKYIYYKAGKEVNHKVKAGDRIIKGGVVDKCLKAKKTLVEEADAKVFGYPYKMIATPVFNQKKEIIGVFAVSESVQLQKSRLQFKEIASEILKNMNILAKDINSLRNQLEHINQVSNSLKQTTEESKEQVKETNDILNLIKNIAYKTNLLGINAAIEATRVGAEGAGFKVVSDEIRKLSVNTGDSVKKIEPIIKQVHANSDNVTDRITQISTSAASIVELVTQARDMTKMISELSKSIDGLADNLLESENR